MGTASTLARCLRRMADRLDPQDVTIDISGMPVVPYTDAELAAWRSAPSGLIDAPSTLTPVDPEYVITESGLRPYRRPESGA